MRWPFLLVFSVVACDGGGAEPSGGAASQGGGGSTGSIGGSPTTTSSTADGAGGSGGTSAVGGSGGAGGVVEDDPCLTATPTCDVGPPGSSGGGLVPLDRCAFSLDRSASFDDFAPLVDALETVAEPATIADVLADLNREPDVVSPGSVPGDPPGVSFAFRWEASENANETWIPQGITGSPDASATGLVEGRRLVMVSFYFDEEIDPNAAPKGVRVALVDVTNPDAPAYRFLLLVEPVAGPTWASVRIHAGGIAWVGDYLYVADTFAGVRVFDMRRIFLADTSENVIGCDATSCKAGLYKYALPQVGAFTRWSACDPAPRYSFVALDRSEDPPRLVTGEYCAATACNGPLDGRVLRHAIDPATGLLAGGDRTFATDAYYAGERQIQGAVSSGDTFFFSSSEPAGSAGILYRAKVGERAAVDWIDTPEDMMIDTTTNEIFSLSEGYDARYVFAADLDAYQ
ncbi:MAG: hypothetical protein HOW73_04890 [Polyangiaceae bacterium]|nr:hypothetical protein [Polyangiaceae bacterium]